MNKSPEELYQEREMRVCDAIELKTPDRVPVLGMLGYIPALWAGITIKEAMYDKDKCMDAWTRAMDHFQIDMAENPFTIRFLGRTLDALDFQQLRWAGRGLGDNASYQFVEDEYMKEDEYDHFLFDPTDFIIRRYWPRVFKAFEPFAALPPPREIMSYYMGLTNFFFFSSPEMVKALDSLSKAAEGAKEMVTAAVQFVERMKGMGFPMQAAGMSQAPFDTISDFMRGTKGGMLDMFRHKDKLLEAVEKMLPIMFELGMGTKRRGGKRVFIPLHKGLDGFMSPEHFKLFYWPTLKRLIEMLIAEGLNPVVLWEGDCTSRLEMIGDIPPGKAVYHFERTDIFKAKEIIGDRVCLRGNVPLSMLCTDTPDDVKAYCRKLIDKVGKGGGFIMDAAAVVDGVKYENLKAMIDFTKEYGRYS
ncbi:MAG: uroporphyrinogen decarboxylase family protein [Pseudomonadota bacterium]